MSTQISKIIEIHMRFFNYIGYCCLAFDSHLNRNTVKERYLILWSCCLMVIFNIVAFVALLSNDAFLFKDDTFGYFNDVLKVIVANIAVTVLYMETLLGRSEAFNFWKNYKALQNAAHVKAKSFTLDDLKEHGRFLLIFYAVILLESLIMFLFIALQEMSRHLVLFWSVFTPFIYAVHMRNLQFVFYIELIRLELVKLKHDLALLVDYSRFATYGRAFKGFEEFLRKNIAKKQRNYQLIYEMFQHFQNAYGFSIIAVLLMIYVRVLVDSYFSYYAIYRNRSTIAGPFLIIPAVFQIPIFLITSKNCMDVIKSITFNLHNIISQFNNQDSVISTQLQNFSLQILHQKICINGIGISRMDGYMLTRAIGSVTTYMIFFIQFMPKFTNLQDDKLH